MLINGTDMKMQRVCFKISGSRTIFFASNDLHKKPVFVYKLVITYKIFTLRAIFCIFPAILYTNIFAISVDLPIEFR